MKVGASFLMVFPIRGMYFDVVDEMSRSAKYEIYLKDADKFICPYKYEDDPIKSLSEKLTKAGFGINRIEMKGTIFVHPSLDHIKSN